MKLQDKVVVITGASRGLGLAMATEFKKQGAKLVLSANERDELRRVAEGLGAIYFTADVTREVDVKELAAVALKNFNRIDIWVNNAGIWLPHSSIEDLPIEEIRKMLEVNLFGMVYGSRAALGPMKKAEKGMIMNIISVSGIEGHVGSAGYCASKFAENGFTKVLRLETKPFDIKVISVFPDKMKTGLFDGSRPAGYDQFMKPEYVAEKILNNLEKENPEEELIIKK